MKNIIAELRAIKKLPTLPEVMIKVQRLIKDDATSATVIAAIIKRDLAISTTLLKTANSSYYNPLNKKISSIKDAVVRIGFDDVQRILLTTSVIKQFSNTRTAIKYNDFWSHSLTAASLCEEILKKSKYSNDLMLNKYIYFSALLHDIGILVFDQFIHDRFSIVMNNILDKGITYLQSEIDVNPNETHAFIGGALLEIWRMELPVISAVRFHHTPNKAPENMKKLVSIVTIAEYILCTHKIGSFEGGSMDIDQSIWDNAGVSQENKNDLVDIVEIETRKADMILSISANISSENGVSHYSSNDGLLRSI